MGIAAYGGTIGTNIINNGLISGNRWEGIGIFNNAHVGGSIINGGTISGGLYGIRIARSGTVSGAITNSGTISGSNDMA